MLFSPKIIVKLYKRKTFIINNNMDYIQKQPTEELLRMKNKLDKYILNNDYKNAFILFSLYLGKLNYSDRNDMIIYYNNFLERIIDKK
jgi:hypothetical protein